MNTMHPWFYPPPPATGARAPSRLKHLPMLLLVGCLSRPALAQANCALDTVDMLTRGQAADVATRFQGGNAHGLQAKLEAMVEAAGPLSDLAIANGPAFAASERLTARAHGLPDRFAYRGEWVSAKSTAWGRVQWHLAIQLGSHCELLAVHLDRPRRSEGTRAPPD